MAKERGKRISDPKRKAAYRKMLTENSRTAQTMVFVCFVVFLAVAGILIPDRKSSDQENRGLAGLPKLSRSSLADGTFTKGLTDYASDQFAFRDRWISLKFLANEASGIREENGVLIGKKKYLMQTPAVPDTEKNRLRIEAMKAFAQKYPDLNKHFLLVPGAAAIQTQYLPAGVPLQDQKAQIEAIYHELGDAMQCHDISPVLEAHKNEYIYYKTDHHWTSLGAKYAFEGIANPLGIANPIRNYREYVVSRSFEGTLSSTLGSHRTKDEISLYVPQKSDLDYFVKYPGDNSKSATMYSYEGLNKKDQYTVFFGGNHSILKIETTASTGKNLLIFKDSYANTFLQFLLPYYDSITVIDPRYYYEDAASEIQNQQITDVMFLYSADTFFTDDSLTDCLNAIGSVASES